jgi:gluconate 2-dehydrogenase alpha chain
MNETLPQRDVVVIGLGAAGGLAATLLADAGLEVLGIEAGPRHTHDEYMPDEIDHECRNILGAAKANHEVPTVRRRSSDEARPAKDTRGLLMMNGLDGSKVHSTNISWRLLPWNFRSRSCTEERYGAGAIPEDSSLVDWPLTYDDLEPHYQSVEDRYGISGRAGNIHGQTSDGGNPFEGMRTRDYPLPPLRRTGYLDLMSEAAESLGWHPFPTPASIRSENYHGRPGCVYCGSCTWNGCWTDAKCLPSLHGLLAAEARGALTILCEARVTEILVDGEGRAMGVALIRDGQRYIQPARFVVVATYTYENVRLLLLSKSPAFPTGLANNSGQVGRHFMTHSFPMSLGVFPGRKLNRWGGAGAQATGVDDFDGDNFDHTGAGFIGGALLMAPAENKTIVNAMWSAPSVARWGSEWKRWYATHAGSIGWVWTIPDALPYEYNFLDLDPIVRDPLGVPVIRCTYDFGENEHRQCGFLLDRAAQWLEEAGASETWHVPAGPTPVSTHAYGGTRMGNDPASSVVDSWGIAHEVPNLVILGASCFPTAGGVNPTETVEALVSRTVVHLVDEVMPSWRCA